MYKWNDIMCIVFEVGYNVGEKIFNGGLVMEDFGNVKFIVV